METVIKDNLELKYIKEENGNISMFLICKNFLNEQQQKDILLNLNNITDWKDGDIKRLQKWYHDDNKYFADYWKKKDFIRWKSHKMEIWLSNFRDYVSKTIDDIFLDVEKIIPYYETYGINKPNINSTLINYYRNGSDSIKYHKDDEKLFGDNPTIAICNFGQSRPLIFQRTNFNSYSLNKKEQDYDQIFNIEQNDLFLMIGSVQKYYCHGIEKDDSVLSHRYSLTFREHKE